MISDRATERTATANPYSETCWVGPAQWIVGDVDKRVQFKRGLLLRTETVDPLFCVLSNAYPISRDVPTQPRIVVTMPILMQPRLSVPVLPREPQVDGDTPRRCSGPTRLPFPRPHLLPLLIRRESRRIQMIPMLLG